MFGSRAQATRLQQQIAALELVLQNRELVREQVDVVATLRDLQRELSQRLENVEANSATAARSSQIAVAQLALRRVPKAAPVPKAFPPAPEGDA